MAAATAVAATDACHRSHVMAAPRRSCFQLKEMRPKFAPKQVLSHLGSVTVGSSIFFSRKQPTKLVSHQYTS